MKVYTNTPLTTEEMMELSPTNDALIVLGDYRCRYMAASPGQEIEVDYTYYDPKHVALVQELADKVKEVCKAVEAAGMVGYR